MQQVQDEFSHTVLHRHAPAARPGGAGRPAISGGESGEIITIFKRSPSVKASSLISLKLL